MRPYLVSIIAGVLFLIIWVWRLLACEQARCEHGQSVFLARDVRCICAEVPK